MYGPGVGGGVAATGGVGVMGTLAHTGMAAGWMIVAVAALLTVGIILLRLVPKDEF